jgi:hypothetical protein
MNLKTKAKILYWSITALYFIPALLLALIVLICYHIPPKKWFRDGLGERILRLVNKMVLWRRHYVEDWYTFRRDGYRLIIK